MPLLSPLTPNTDRRLINAMGDKAAALEIRAMLGLPLALGNVYWVNSTHASASDSNPGTSKFAPLATVTRALVLATASGDLIVVAAQHTESLAVDLDMDVAGVEVVGLSVGGLRPTLTFTATGAKVDMNAANCRFAGFTLQNDVDSQVAVVDIGAAGCVVENNELLEGSSKQFLIGILIGADRAVVRNNYIKSVAVGANSGIKLASAVDRPLIEGNEVFGDFADAAIHNPTSAVCTRCNITRNNLTNLQSGDHAIELVSACTGVISYNIVNSSLAAAATKTAIDPGSCYCVENYGHDAADDTSGILNPVADS